MVARSPRIHPSQQARISAKKCPAWIQNRLLTCTDLGPIVVGTGAHEPKLRCSLGRVILKMQPIPPAMTVCDRLGFINGSRPSRLPVHSIEDDEKNVFFSRIQSPLLNLEKVRLIEVFRLGIQRLRRNPSINSL